MEDHSRGAAHASFNETVLTTPAAPSTVGQTPTWLPFALEITSLSTLSPAVDLEELLTAKIRASHAREQYDALKTMYGRTYTQAENWMALPRPYSYEVRRRIRQLKERLAGLHPRVEELRKETKSAELHADSLVLNLMLSEDVARNSLNERRTHFADTPTYKEFDVKF